MILVFIFRIFIFFLILLISILSLSKIKIEVYNSNIEKQKKINLKIKILFLGIIQIFSIKINEKKLKKIYNKGRFKNINYKTLKKINRINKDSVLELIKSNINIKKIILYLNLGAKNNVVITSYITAIISILISIIMPYLVKNINKENFYYNIQPNYEKKNFKYHFECIIDITILKIVYVIYKFIKIGRRKSKNERTSNRRTYEYCHEFD